MLPKSTARVLDANIILRFLTNGPSHQTTQIKKLLESKKDRLVLTEVTVAEIVWVLTSYYKQTKKSVVEKVLTLLELPVIVANRKLLSGALLTYLEFNIDYIDAYLLALAKEKKLAGIVSLDRSLDK